MKNEDFNTNLNSRIDGLRPTLTEVANQLFKQDFQIEHSLIGSGVPHVDILNDVFPKVALTFNSNSGIPVKHVLLLTPEMVLSLYAWMIDGEVEEAVTEAHLEGIKEGSEQFVGQIRAILDGEGAVLEISDLQVTLTEDPAELHLEAAEQTGSAVSYAVRVGETTFMINHYLFAAFSEAGAEASSTGITDEEIDKMLNGEDLDERINIDDDLGLDDVGVKQVEFGDFGNQAVGNNGKPRNIDMLLDVDLEVLVELGRKNMLIKDVLKLGKGSVVELDKAAGEPLGIFVNGRKLAEGEVVVVDDHFGIRITQLAGTAERIQSLG